jgi:hypothetical protein
MAVEDFANGANILQQVDVSQIFKSLAMGIAEAQKDLDENSIAQLQELSETELAGKSLLELGFVPAFYSFTYADISASIHLRMAEKTSFELGVKANFDFASSSGGESDFSNLSKEHQFFSEKEEFKSNRKFMMRSSSIQEIKVNNQHYSLDQTKGCISKIEKFHDQLLLNQKIERLNIQRSNAYTTVYKPLSDYTILVITDYSGSTATGGSVTVNINTDFDATFTGLPTGTLGLSGSTMYGLPGGPHDLEFFFNFDKRVMNFDYDEDYTGIANKELVFEALATILKMDPSLTVTVEGYTDSRGDLNYNDNLSQDRCTAMIDWLASKGAPRTQLVPQAQSESLALSNNGPDNTKNPLFRKVRIILPANRSYIFFNSVLTSPNPSVTITANFFIEAVAPTQYFILNGNADGFEATGLSLSSSLTDYAEANETEFHVEERENTLYLLRQDTEITYMAYSLNSETIEIVAEEGSEESIRVYNNENETERIQNLATKNRSDRTFAAGASVDFRFSRQFEMSIEGSASMSARMVAVPPPEAFTLHIATVYNPPPPTP